MRRPRRQTRPLPPAPIDRSLLLEVQSGEHADHTSAGHPFDCHPRSDEAVADHSLPDLRSRPRRTSLATHPDPPRTCSPGFPRTETRRRTWMQHPAHLEYLLETSSALVSAPLPPPLGLVESRIAGCADRPRRWSPAAAASSAHISCAACSPRRRAASWCSTAYATGASATSPVSRSRGPIVRVSHTLGATIRPSRASSRGLDHLFHLAAGEAQSASHDPERSCAPTSLGTHALFAAASARREEDVSPPRSTATAGSPGRLHRDRSARSRPPSTASRSSPASTLLAHRRAGQALRGDPPVLLRLRPEAVLRDGYPRSSSRTSPASSRRASRRW